MRSAKRGSVYLLTDEYFANADAEMFPVRERFHCWDIRFSADEVLFIFLSFYPSFGVFFAESNAFYRY